MPKYLVGYLAGMLVAFGMWGLQRYEQAQRPGCDIRDADCRVLAGPAKVEAGAVIQHIDIIVRGEPCFTVSADLLSQANFSKVTKIQDVYCYDFDGDKP